MSFLQELVHNRIFVSAVLGWFIAQVLKTIIHLFLTKQFVAERMIGSGGMPSSHSATVCALATATGMVYGGGSFEFAIAVILAIIVMHDAMGVRREAGKHAKILNDLLASLSKDAPPEDVLKEFLGHTPLQVCFGALLGFCVALLLG